MHDAPSLSFSIAALNRATESQAAAMMDRVVERSPWLAHRVAAARPFDDAQDLADWLAAEVRGLSRSEAVQLLCAHPELAPTEPTRMTAASQSEQARLQLDVPDPALSAQFADLNRRYLRAHGYPFVIALHAQDSVADVISQFEDRLCAGADEELARSLGEVISVMSTRLAKLVGAARRAPGAASDPGPAAPKGGVSS